MSRRPRHRLVAGPAALLAVVLAGCDAMSTSTTPQAGPPTLIVSEVWRNGATDEEVATRISSLQRAVEQLRKETGTGWVGRQDDVTGYLADLSGGGRTGLPAEFMDAYGPSLFGIDSTVLDLADPDTATVPGMVSTRAAQRVGTVPVLDGELLFVSRAGSTPAADRLTGVRGRVFPGLSVSTRPQLGRRAAARIAIEASGGEVRNRTTLAVLPTGAGILAWQVTILAGPDSSFGSGNYYVDAVTGDIVDVRPISADAHASTSRRGSLEPDPNSVEVSGVDPLGRSLLAHGLRRSDGVELTDTTTPFWDQASRRGGVSIYDATGSSSFEDLPGTLVVNPDTAVRDPEALAAAAYGRAVLDYFAELGRSSWDGEGGTLVGAVNYGPPDLCNSYFFWAIQPPLMAYGDPCVIDGTLHTASVVEPDLVGHEITHGVTATSSHLVYAGQSGALNEGFSDYFGNVIGDQLHGADSAAFAEDACEGITTDTILCYANPDGTRSWRYLLNGYDYDDYLRLLDPGRRLKERNLAFQDNGGVHLNSGIWNNALWSIRTQLAKIDNQPGTTSPLARSFDRAVLAALTARLTPTSGFLEARAAVEQSVVDLGLDPVVLRVSREVFDTLKICTGCPTTPPLPGSTVSASSATELHPNVSGDRVAWLNANPEGFGNLATASADGSGVTRGSDPGVVAIGFAGEALMTLDVGGNVRRTDASGNQQVVTKVNAYNTFLRGFGGSDAGAAWATGRDQLTFASPEGGLTTTTLSGLGEDGVSGVGTGGGYVGAGTLQGRVFGWQPGASPVELGRMDAPVINVAAHGGNVLAVACSASDDVSPLTCEVKLFTADGRTYGLSDNAMVFGAAMSAEHAVWPEVVGNLSGGVLGNDSYSPRDTDLRLVSLATGKIYDVTPEPGQQGFPALSGRRLVWQDTAFGGDDIRTLVLPAGL